MSTLKDKCYKLWQIYVTERDVICQNCGDTPISGHHVFGRRNHGSAFDPDSGIGLCANCHDGWARLCPEEVRGKLREKLGDDEFNRLQALTRDTVRLRDKDYLRIAYGLGSRIAGMRGRK
jgi:hypothetical protein